MVLGCRMGVEVRALLGEMAEEKMDGDCAEAKDGVRREYTTAC